MHAADLGCGRVISCLGLIGMREGMVCGPIVGGKRDLLTLDSRFALLKYTHKYVESTLAWKIRVERANVVSHNGSRVYKGCIVSAGLVRTTTSLEE